MFRPRFTNAEKPSTNDCSEAKPSASTQRSRSARQDSKTAVLTGLLSSDQAGRTVRARVVHAVRVCKPGCIPANETPSGASRRSASTRSFNTAVPARSLRTLSQSSSHVEKTSPTVRVIRRSLMDLKPGVGVGPTSKANGITEAVETVQKPRSCTPFSRTSSRTQPLVQHKGIRSQPPGVHSAVNDRGCVRVQERKGISGMKGESGPRSDPIPVHAFPAADAPVPPLLLASETGGKVGSSSPQGRQVQRSPTLHYPFSSPLRFAVVPGNGSQAKALPDAARRPTPLSSLKTQRPDVSVDTTRTPEAGSQMVEHKRALNTTRVSHAYTPSRPANGRNPVQRQQTLSGNVSSAAQVHTQRNVSPYRGLSSSRDPMDAARLASRSKNVSRILDRMSSSINVEAPIVTFAFPSWDSIERYPDALYDANTMEASKPSLHVPHPSSPPQPDHGSLSLGPRGSSSPVPNGTERMDEGSPARALEEDAFEDAEREITDSRVLFRDRLASVMSLDAFVHRLRRAQQGSIMSIMGYPTETHDALLRSVQDVVIV